MLCLKPFDFNDFRLKLTKYLMFSNRYFFFVKLSEIELSQKSYGHSFLRSVVHAERLF